MNDLEQKIIEVCGENLGIVSLFSIKQFISKCSLSDFEKLKELDYDLSQSKDYLNPDFNPGDTEIIY